MLTFPLMGSDMVKSWPGPGKKNNLLYSTILTHAIRCRKRNNGFMGASLAYCGYEIKLSIPVFLFPVRILHPPFQASLKVIRSEIFIDANE